VSSFWARYAENVPPGFEGQPVLFTLTVFSLLIVVLFAMEWAWRIVWGAFENPFPLKHPITVLRTILFTVSVSVVLRVAPLVMRFALWKEMSPEWRLSMYQASHSMDIVSVIPWIVAWTLGYLTMPFLHYQLDKKPIPMHLWPTRQQLTRPLKIILAVMFISIAITFYG
jgi:hypothetical protein